MVADPREQKLGEQYDAKIIMHWRDPH